MEQSHDDDGIIWPMPIAPFEVIVTILGKEETVHAAANDVYEQLVAAGVDVLLDDRDERPGEKFADADLVGCPVRVIVGKMSLDDGAVDVRKRDGSAEVRVAAADVLKWATQS